MPTREAPSNVNEPTGPEANEPRNGAEQQSGSAPEERPLEVQGYTGQSRWVNYETHELLSMIGELEDERRWARLREGILWALLLHFGLVLMLAMLPKYIFVPRVIQPSIKAQPHEDWTYLDTPKDLVRPKLQKPLTTPVPEKPPTIDQKTLDELQKQAPSAPAPKPQEASPKPAPPAQPIPPAQQGQIEAPRPAAVPAHPNFAMMGQNPADQMREAMKNAHGPGAGSAAQMPHNGGMALHPGAGTGGIQVLSDTQGVDFTSWLQRWHRETEQTWDPLIPDEVNPPIYKSGMVAIRFKVAPNGRIMDGSMVLEGRSGDVALDRAAWGALTGSNYPPLPREFHGPYLELRAFFLYNMEAPK